MCRKFRESFCHDPINCILCSIGVFLSNLVTFLYTEDIMQNQRKLEENIAFYFKLLNSSITMKHVRKSIFF